MSEHFLLGIAGSLRAGATNRLLVAEAARLYGPDRFEMANLRLPLYDGDVEDSLGIPAEVQRLAEAIDRADAVVISTPEYNKMLSGVLKNALDWVSRVEGNPWRDKPVAVMSAAAGRAGGERGQLSLRIALMPFRARLVAGPEVAVADARNAFDENGRLKSARYERSLKELMDGLRTEVELVRHLAGKSADASKVAAA